MPRAAAFSRIVAPDMPGFGDAAKPRHFDYSPRGYTRHLSALLERLGVKRAHLVLHDFGVAWGLGWAVENLDAVASATSTTPFSLQTVHEAGGFREGDGRRLTASPFA